MRKHLAAAATAGAALAVAVGLGTTPVAAATATWTVTPGGTFETPGTAHFSYLTDATTALFSTVKA